LLIAELQNAGIPGKAGLLPVNPQVREDSWIQLKTRYRLAVAFFDAQDRSTASGGLRAVGSAR